ncbi:flagellar biosynthesis anti-sigma factor FlgM [Endozoicomonas arenosclerae]|uniref:flagellar biosynthesis anti-sigma factor FlgM n=1 Tax=Endozoicomonas arenosclerae TaxID=1633495 RepID=UPI00078441DA|nr:flagellar biosynthesis anti-sigma factor FlgM [Endozoicomonas arenosclerae]
MEDSRKTEAETRTSIPSRNTEERLMALRKAYLAGELKVDSARVADKLMAFESTLEKALNEKQS